MSNEFSDDYPCKQIMFNPIGLSEGDQLWLRQKDWSCFFVFTWLREHPKMVFTRVELM